MKIKITIPSSCEGSETTLHLSNVKETGDLEILLTISSASGEQDIFVLSKNLKDAINKLC